MEEQMVWGASRLDQSGDCTRERGSYKKGYRGGREKSAHKKEKWPPKSSVLNRIDGDETKR